MTAISLVDVTKAYGDTVVLPNLSLDITDGELMVLLGPSGSGKSTILRIIAGLEAVTSGEVHFDGRDVTALPTAERDVAMVFQDLGLYSHLTAGGNIRFPLRLRKMEPAEAEARVAEQAGRLGLSRLLERRPGQLSSGHRHAVATGRALVRDSAVLLMDEPLAQLDTPVRRRMRTEIARTQRELGNTTIYVTNDPIEAMAVGHRVAVFDDGGALQQLGSPREAYRQPANVFVGQFMGALSIVPAAVEEDGDGIWLRIGTDRLAMPADTAMKLSRFVGGVVLAGVRPEHLRPAQPGDGFHHCLHATVRSLEQLGSTVLIHATVGSSEMIARDDAAVPLGPGEPVELATEPDRILFFDPGTEVALG